MVEYDDGEIKWESAYEPLVGEWCQRTKCYPKLARHCGKCPAAPPQKLKVVLKRKLGVEAGFD